jgi:hypothetical protein
MNKKYIVQLIDEERQRLLQLTSNSNFSIARGSGLPINTQRAKVASSTHQGGPDDEPLHLRCAPEHLTPLAWPLHGRSALALRHPCLAARWPRGLVGAWVESTVVHAKTGE